MRAWEDLTATWKDFVALCYQRPCIDLSSIWLVKLSFVSSQIELRANKSIRGR